MDGFLLLHQRNWVGKADVKGFLGLVICCERVFGPADRMWKGVWACWSDVKGCLGLVIGCERVFGPGDLMWKGVWAWWSDVKGCLGLVIWCERVFRPGDLLQWEGWQPWQLNMLICCNDSSDSAEAPLKRQPSSYDSFSPRLPTHWQVTAVVPINCLQLDLYELGNILFLILPNGTLQFNAEPGRH